MRAVSYFTHHRPFRRALPAFGHAWLDRAAWSDAVELPSVRSVGLVHPELPPAFDGLRIAQVSDLHAGAFMPPTRIARVHTLVAGLSPDLVVFTGDQLDRREYDADHFVQGMAGLDAPLGVFGILGNHDHIAGPELAIQAMEAVGIAPLVNSAAILQRGTARLALVGVDDLLPSPGWGADFRVLEGLPGFRLLLCHQPSGWRVARRHGAHITLAGHTHGGQITVPTRGLNVARLGTRYVAGPYRKQGTLLYVSRGVGVGAVPIRLGCLPEIDLITLRRGPLGAF
ncbi:MAG: metallophosphoesterase [Thermoanaerobaculaceae bacterium]|nr:metallophosphoesterase [Thermoanaerobaculaceae bacterium]MDI9621363.1 metallophosphoesterase [Acidobacteriota bacterium]NLH10360.1 metallophosphoesterase [Holophagae bacterium]HPW56293.1 metallophosphoesterase [Thermoanaerobaculaceae bacterium]